MTAPAPDRTSPEALRRFVGKKVMVSTADFHHVVGRFVALGDDDRLKILVGAEDREILVARTGVDSIRVVRPEIAEYLK